MNYSVLMSVYYKEKPEYLRQSMQSIYNQTVPTDDFVLVCDGQLNSKLDQVIADMHQFMGDILNVVRLEKNVGLGNALNIGIKYCKYNLIARMDSDDISHPDRCEKELAIFASKDVSIVSAAVEEFTVTPDVIDSRRVPPENHDEIMKFSKKRNPFNHPCVMYSKIAVETAGGYQDFFLLEDYYLWIRMLINGNKGYNIQEPLLWMRAGSDLYKRRSGWKYARTQCKLFNFMRKQGYIGMSSCLISCFTRTCSSCAPNWLRKGVFKRLLRKGIDKGLL